MKSGTEKNLNPLAGYLAAASVMLIWATWLVASRSAAISSLTIYDLAAMRYGISAIFALPVVLYFKPWRSMSLGRILIFSLLMSPFYILCVFAGFNYAPASHGGIFMNGILPALTLFLSWICFSEKAAKHQIVGVLMIFCGAFLALIDGNQLGFSESWRGDLFFVAGACFFSGYLIVSRHWQISTTQILLCSSVLNAIVYVPIWYIWLPSGVEAASQNQLVIQILYQGLIPNLLGLLLVAYAVRNVGSAATAAFMAGVPAMGTVLSMLILSEFPGVYGWLSLFILTPGIILVAVIKRHKFQ